MSLQPLPHGLGEFSIAMTDDASLASLWPLPPTLHDLHCYQSAVDVKQRLVAVTAELREAREEVRHKEHNIASLVEQVHRTVQERDLLRQQQHLLLACEMEASATPTACPLLPSSPPPVAVNRAATFAVPSSAAVDGRSTAAAPPQVPRFAARELSPVTLGRASATQTACPLHTSSPSLVAVNRAATLALHNSAAVDNRSTAAPPLQVPSVVARELPPVTSGRASATHAALPLTSSPSPVAFDRAAMVKPFAVPGSAAAAVVNRSMAAALEVPSFAALVCEDRSTAMALEMLAARRPLPEQGRLVQAVMEAAPLLQNLLMAGPLPQWRNPPPPQALADAMIWVPSSSGAPMGLPWPID